MKGELVNVLGFFSKKRLELVNRTLDETPELFSCFFNFENDKEGISIVFEKEKIRFINSHFSNVEEFCSSDFSLNLYREGMRTLINRLSSDVRYSQHHSMLTSKDLLDEKSRLLDQLLSISEKSNDSINKLKYHIAKDNRIFERMLEDMSRGD
ncbi:hypothetical protein AB7W40_22800 [Providencia rettgeri]